MTTDTEKERERESQTVIRGYWSAYCFAFSCSHLHHDTWSSPFRFIYMLQGPHVLRAQTLFFFLSFSFLNFNGQEKLYKHLKKI